MKGLGIIDISDEDTIVGKLLNDQYVITKFLNKGSHSQVYNVIDLKCPNANLVVKISPNHIELCQEINVINNVKKHSTGNSSTPFVKDFSMMMIK
jgi:hypothetical protein